jgi:secreted PhoX family phosphatase
MRKLVSLSVAGLVALASGAAASGGFDFGKWRDKALRVAAKQLFGVKKPLLNSSTESVDQATAEADPTTLVTVAKDLDVRVVSSAPDLGPNTDMMAFWPNDQNPTHLIVCNEEGPTEPGVQRVRLSDGDVDTILTGTENCDPVRRTPWGTILVAEEAGPSGQAIEIIKPLQTTDVIFDRVTGTASGGTGAENVASRRGLGRLSFEGIALYPNAVMYYADENRPATGTAGGAYFKFIPSTPWPGGVITDLDQSPLTSGTIYGLRLGKRSGNTDYGQGSNTGLGVWVPIPPGDPTEGQDLRAQAALLKLTGYYRPEDLEVDPLALFQGQVRACGANTGNEEDDQNFGEAICITDGTLAEATDNTAVPAAQLLVIGTPELAMMDNVTFDPERRNWILHEDGAGPDVGRNNDLWSCLEDGEDDDLLSDGCVRVATLNDLNAEWTGGIFDPSGQHFYVSVQHNVTGHGVILEIRDWED